MTTFDGSTIVNALNSIYAALTSGGSGGGVVTQPTASQLNATATQGPAGASAWKVDGSGVTQPVSAASLPLPTGAAQDGTDGASPPSIAGAGIRGWLRAIYDRLGGALAVQTGQAQTTAIPAGTVGNTVVKAAPGRLGKVLVTTLGVGAMAIYDNATTNSGTVIGMLIANAPVGTVVALQMPAANGITAAGGSTTPGVTVSWT